MTTEQSPQNNSEMKTILLCENCLQKLRVPLPASGKKLRVTCPKCRHSFLFRNDPKDLRHYEHEYFHFAIVHQDSHLAKYEQPILGPTRKTYQYARTAPFHWEITRPKTGKKKYSMLCPHCTKQLDVQLESLEKLARDKRNFRKLKSILLPISVIVFLFSVGIIVLDSKASALLGNWDYLALLIFPAFITFFAMILRLENPLGGYSNIKMQVIEPTLPGHYFAYIESH